MNALLSYAFRPFFLFAAAFAIVALVIWIAVWHGMIGPGLIDGDAVLWHGHEMLVGFVGAAVAGFALTAVATWTERPPVRGLSLASLLLAWLAGRIAMLMTPALPAVAVAAMDTLFPLLLCAYLMREVLAGRNMRNYPIVLVVLAMALCNLLYHLGDSRTALLLLVHLALLLISVVAGRIIPNFTANWLRARGNQKLPKSKAWLDGLAIGATVAVGVADGLMSMPAITAALAAAAAMLHLARLANWRGLATSSEPLLFVLHVAYAWLPIGYALLAAAESAFGVPYSAALHGLTMGCVGSMILAVMTRVALGHTGRPLHAARLTVAAYIVFTLAVVLRVAASASGEAYAVWVDLAATGWIISFVFFLVVYTPILIRARADAA